MTDNKPLPSSVSLLNHSVLSVIAVGSFLSFIGGSVYISQSLGDGFSSSGGPGHDTSRVDEEAGGGGNGALFRAPKDNSRNQWRWTANDGWRLDVIEETYENGWHWLWTPDGWQWVDGDMRHAAAPDAPVEDETTSIAADSMPGCFAADGSLVTQRSSCASDQAAAAMEADEKKLPQAYRDLLRDAAPLLPEEEQAVHAVLTDHFNTTYVGAARQSMGSAASAVISRLQILKDATGITENERMFFVEKIIGMQKALARTSDASDRDDIALLTKDIGSLTTEVATYVRDHAISIHIEHAPSAVEILKASARIMHALSAALDAAEKDGIAVERVRAMHASLLQMHAEVTVRCSLGQDCNRVKDVVSMLDQTVTALRELVDATGNTVLKSKVEHAFDGGF